MVSLSAYIEEATGAVSESCFFLSYDCCSSSQDACAVAVWSQQPSHREEESVQRERLQQIELRARRPFILTTTSDPIIHNQQS